MAAIATLPVLFATGIHASRPAASAVGKGGLYSCTTHSLVYQTDGSSWSTWANLAGTGGTGTVTTVEEVDGSPTDSAVTKIVFPNGTLGIASHVATYTPSGSFPTSGYATVATDQALGAGAYADLATVGPAVTITVNTKVKVTLSADGYDAASGTSYGKMAVALSSGNTVAAADTSCLAIGKNSGGDSTQASRVLYFSGLTPGSTVFTAKYKASSTNYHMRYREILVECMD
jgi:hypothetical protein